VVLDFGNDYVATCGQLKEIQVVENEYMEQGQIIGYVAEPTKYYSIEGSNIYFELKRQDKVVDPLDYLQ
jgi:septal ring factor EnvC (AmiA/AmiB activator)